MPGTMTCIAAIVRAWRLDPGGELPVLEHAPGSPVIEARSIGEHGPSGVKFWTELGLDARKLTHRPSDGFYETAATLDFRGRVAK